jgi:ribonuclease R
MSGKTKKRKNKKIKDVNKFEKQIVEAFANSPYEPLNIKQLSRRLEIMDAASKKILQSFVYKLENKDILVRVSRSKHKLNPELITDFTAANRITGRVEMKSTGKAYIITPELDEDVFIAANNTGKAFDGDTVEVQLFPKRGRRKTEGKIVKVLKRATVFFVGKLEVSKNFAFLVPDKTSMPHDFFIPMSKLNGAKNGEKVIVKFTEWPDHAKNPFAEVYEVLGQPGENDVEMKSILIANDFPVSFPKEVLKAAEKIENKVHPEEIKKRRDFRNVFTCTIDPVDAKDFDDALSIRKLKNGHWEVGVHIADVSHYVTKGSAIDKEAYNRGTSIYLVDRVIPMLPEKLSNLVCSLRPDEEKLTFSAVFEMTDDAEIKKEWIGRTVIKSNRRYAYEEVQEMIEGRAGDENKELLLKLNDLSKKLREERFRKGSIAFRSQEVRFNLDENGKPIGAYVREQKEAHMLIEDFMLLANRKVAEKIGKVSGKTKAKTFVYRIHDTPNAEKLNTFSEFIKKFGYRISLANRRSLVTSLNNLFEQIRGKGEEHLIETIAVRTMAKAVYSTENIGHYGLAFKYYTHFTSPIRRYPDLMVHRLLEHYLNGGKSVNADEYEEYCKHSSDMERKAVEAERESVKYKQAEYMLDKVGQEFDGIISGVSKWGVFVEVTEVKAEGMVPIDSLDDDYYYLDEDNYQIIGRRYGNIYRLGDNVKVMVNKVDLLKKQMEFRFTE